MAANETPKLVRIDTVQNNSKVLVRAIVLGGELWVPMPGGSFTPVEVHGTLPVEVIERGNE